MNDYQIAFGRRIRQLMNRCEITQEEVSHRAGYPRQCFSGTEDACIATVAAVAHYRKVVGVPWPNVNIELGWSGLELACEARQHYGTLPLKP